VVGERTLENIAFPDFLDCLANSMRRLQGLRDVSEFSYNWNLGFIRNLND
jgi:hypothetical protein